MKIVKNIGTTSFIIHDNRLTNVLYLQNVVDIVQLLYLESNFLDEEIMEIEKLNDIKGEIDYLIHMPIDLNLSMPAHWQLFRSFLNNVSVLNPKGYIIHPEDSHIFFSTLEELTNSYNLIVENITDTSFFDNIANIGAEICFDVGHALLCNIDIKKFINDYSNLISIFHIHGVKDNTDHISLRYLDEKLLDYILSFASEKSSDIIIEVFNHNDLIDSLNYLKEVFQKYGYSYHRWD
ncbi:MAG: hypothetical protein K6348_02665 [Deferribacterales bacterium]